MNGGGIKSYKIWSIITYVYQMLLLGNLKIISKTRMGHQGHYWKSREFNTPIYHVFILNTGKIFQRTN